MKSHFLSITCALSFSFLAGGIHAQSETEEGFLVKPKENYLKDVERAAAAYRKSIDEARKKLLSATTRMITFSRTGMRRWRASRSITAPSARPRSAGSARSASKSRS